MLLMTASAADDPQHRRVRPAPRLSADERIAGVITRTGRFAALNPAKPGTRPSWPQLAGVLAWAAFTAGCGLAAWRRHRQ